MIERCRSLFVINPFHSITLAMRMWIRGVIVGVMGGLKYHTNDNMINAAMVVMVCGCPGNQGATMWGSQKK